MSVDDDDAMDDADLVQIDQSYKLATTTTNTVCHRRTYMQTLPTGRINLVCRLSHVLQLISAKPGPLPRDIHLRLGLPLTRLARLGGGDEALHRLQELYSSWVLIARAPQHYRQAVGRSRDRWPQHARAARPPDAHGRQRAPGAADEAETLAVALVAAVAAAAEHPELAFPEHAQRAAVPQSGHSGQRRPAVQHERQHSLSEERTHRPKQTRQHGGERSAAVLRA
jgi:hypothetical protein